MAGVMFVLIILSMLLLALCIYLGISTESSINSGTLPLEKFSTLNEFSGFPMPLLNDFIFDRPKYSDSYFF
jgi:hypothetical protein